MSTGTGKNSKRKWRQWLADAKAGRLRHTTKKKPTPQKQQHLPARGYSQ